MPSISLMSHSLVAESYRPVDLDLRNHGSFASLIQCLRERKVFGLYRSPL